MTREHGKPALTVTSLGDILGILGVLFGYRPQESLVVLSLQKGRSRLGFGARVDMPSAASAHEIAAMLSHHMRRQRVEAAMVFGLSADESAAEVAVRAAAVRLTYDDVRVLGAAVAHGGQYRELDDTLNGLGPACPYDAVASPLLVAAVAEGATVRSDRSELESLVQPVQGAQREAMLLSASRSLAETAELASSTTAERLVETVMGRVSRLRRSNAPSDEELVAAAVWLEVVPTVRDRLWSQIPGKEAGEHLGFWLRVAAVAVPPFDSVVLALVSFAAWQCGDGTLARIACERALISDPASPAAALLLAVLDAGCAPEEWESIDRSRE